MQDTNRYVCLICFIFQFYVIQSFLTPARFISSKFAIQSQIISNMKLVTGGEMVSFEDVSISAGHSEIINNINWAILPFERWGIVGRNGAGELYFCKFQYGPIYDCM